MPIVRAGGSNPLAGQVNTTMGMRAARPPLCYRCGQRREEQLYTVNANGQQVCADCAGARDAGVLKGTCDPENCACTKVEHDGDDLS